MFCGLLIGIFLRIPYFEKELAPPYLKLSTNGFAASRKMNILEKSRDRFFDFDHGHVTEGVKVEKYWFLKKIFNVLSILISKTSKAGVKICRFFNIYL